MSTLSLGMQAASDLTDELISKWYMLYKGRWIETPLVWQLQTPSISEGTGRSFQELGARGGQRAVLSARKAWHSHRSLDTSPVDVGL